METKYAPPEREDLETLSIQYKFIQQLSDLKEVLNTVPNFVLVLNQKRQIIYSNDLFNEFLGMDDTKTILGRRPGEAIGCLHSDEMEGGCGTSEFCRECGAVHAILESQLKKARSNKECRISLKDGTSLDLLVWATPLNRQGREFTIFAAEDISPDKRRRALERIFFHDILNTAGTLQGYFEILDDCDENERNEFIHTSKEITYMLIDEIQAQRQLLAAENDEYQPDLSKIETYKFLGEIRGFFQHHRLADARQIILGEVENLEINTDLTLLRRVITNLVKNALEAVPKESTVTLSCLKKNDRVEFSVHNPGFIPRKIQLQIFQRSFSTKGTGRGLGTYSIKLLSEKYLDGKVRFESSEENGTTFYAEYPVTLELKKEME